MHPIYCKRGYFRLGKISQKCWQDISRVANFHETTPISFINAYFREEDNLRAKNAKISPKRKFPRLQYIYLLLHGHKTNKKVCLENKSKNLFPVNL